MVVYSCHQFFWVGSQITWTYADCFKFKSSRSVSCSYFQCADDCQSLPVTKAVYSSVANQHASKSGPIFHLKFEPQNWFRHAHLCGVQWEHGSRMVRWISDKTWFWSADAGFQAAETEPQADSRASATPPSLRLQEVTNKVLDNIPVTQRLLLHQHWCLIVLHTFFWGGRSGLGTQVCTNFSPVSAAAHAQPSRMLNESLIVGSH